MNSKYIYVAENRSDRKIQIKNANKLELHIHTHDKLHLTSAEDHGISIKFEPRRRTYRRIVWRRKANYPAIHVRI